MWLLFCTDRLWQERQSEHALHWHALWACSCRDMPWHRTQAGCCCNSSLGRHARTSMDFGKHAMDWPSHGACRTCIQAPSQSSCETRSSQPAMNSKGQQCSSVQVIVCVGSGIMSLGHPLLKWECSWCTLHMARETSRPCERAGFKGLRGLKRLK